MYLIRRNCIVSHVLKIIQVNLTITFKVIIESHIITIIFENR